MKQNLLALPLGLALSMMAPEHVAAQTKKCGERSNIVERLNTGYGETRKSLGLAGNQGIVELYASDATGSWTITVTHPNGLTCLLAAGTSFETLNEELPAALGAPT